LIGKFKPISNNILEATVYFSRLNLPTFPPILQKCKIKVSFVRLGYGKQSFFDVN